MSIRPCRLQSCCHRREPRPRPSSHRRRARCTRRLGLDPTPGSPPPPSRSRSTATTDGPRPRIGDRRRVAVAPALPDASGPEHQGHPAEQSHPWRWRRYRRFARTHAAAWPEPPPSRKVSRRFDAKLVPRLRTGHRIARITRFTWGSGLADPRRLWITLDRGQLRQTDSPVWLGGTLARTDQLRHEPGKDL